MSQNFNSHIQVFLIAVCCSSIERLGRRPGVELKNWKGGTKICQRKSRPSRPFTLLEQISKMLTQGLLTQRKLNYLLTVFWQLLLSFSAKCSRAMCSGCIFLLFHSQTYWPGSNRKETEWNCPYAPNNNWRTRIKRLSRFTSFKWEKQKTKTKQKTTI